MTGGNLSGNRRDLLDISAILLVLVMTTSSAFHFPDRKIPPAFPPLYEDKAVPAYLHQKTFSCHDDAAVNLVLWIHKMYVTGGHHRFLELLSKFYDLPVDLFKSSSLSTAESIIFFDHKRIVPDRLDFQIIVEIYQSRDLRIRLHSQKCLIKLARLAGTFRSSGLPGISSTLLGSLGLRL